MSLKTINVNVDVVDDYCKMCPWLDIRQDYAPHYEGSVEADRFFFCTHVAYCSNKKLEEENMIDYIDRDNDGDSQNKDI